MTIANANGASFKHNEFRAAEAPRKTTVHSAINPHVNRIESKPAGKCRPLVRGLRASISASSTRLNAIATDLAATIATMIQTSFQSKPSRGNPDSRQASNAPVNANGNAKIECSNLIISSVSKSFFNGTISYCAIRYFGCATTRR